MAAVEGCEVAAFCIAEWARKAARKFERKGRLVVIVVMSVVVLGFGTPDVRVSKILVLRRG